jgi:type II secretory pathway component PulF
MGYAKSRIAKPSPKTGAQASGNAGSLTKSNASVLSMRIGKKRTNLTKLEVLLLTGELADLLEAGMQLGTALKALSNQGEEDSPQQEICRDLCNRIVSGETFSEACAHHPKSFEPLYINMIRAGEASGAMVEVLRRLVDHYERYDNMRSKIKSAMSYPIIVLCFGVLAVIGAMVWIIPQFKKVFDSLGAALPLPTRILIGASDFCVNYGWLLAVVSILFAVWFKKWKSSEKGQYRIDGWKLKMPLVKGIIASGAYSSLAYTLKTLLVNGVNVLSALRICQETCGNAVIAAALKTARDRVTDGTSISGPLSSSGVFPKMLTDMLAVGEQAGDMPSALEHIGRRYQKDMERNIAVFTNALEPILIIFIAGVIGFVAIAILMAVFKVSSSLG